MSLQRLKQNLKNDLSNFLPVSLVLMGDSPTQLMDIAIRGTGIDEGLNISVFEAPYNQLDFQILNASSEFYQLQPKFVVITESSEKLQQKFYKLSAEDKRDFAEAKIDQLRNYFDNINDRIQTTIIYSNYVEINDSVFGNYSSKSDLSFLNQLRKINYLLTEISKEYKNVVINDVSSLQNFHGRNFTHSATLFTNTGMIYSTEFLPYFATNIVDIIKAFQGKIKKCIVLDLDNTLWGGIIGDDGMDGIQIGNLGIGETFSRFQSWIKQLKQRGIILAICSKNEEKNAMQPFLEHPDMVLRMEDIAVFVANWDNKADNIRYIQSILNIGFDSMVFLDDNPVERKIVRENVPNITVPELPEDPAEYQHFLQQLNLFETASLSETDSDRTLQYQEESKRTRQKMSFLNEDDFLKSLEMTAEINAFQQNDIPRISELTQRSNQFNLRTIRYSEDDIIRIMKDELTQTLAFKLNDSYGSYGLVSLVILKNQNDSSLFIDSWLMSCRVLKRGLENLVLNEIVRIAKDLGLKQVIGEYIPTLKNDLVKEHYKNLGFVEAELPNQFKLEVESYSPRNHFISSML